MTKPAVSLICIRQTWKPMIQQILNCLPRINDCRSVVLCNFRCYISITFSIIRYLGEQTFHNSFLLGYLSLIHI